MFIERSLRQLAAGDQPDLTAVTMQWMVLTWDLARIVPEEGVSRCVRLFLTADEALVADGDRTAARFHRTAPKLGAVRDSRASLDEPLRYAQSTTALALEQGFRMVCRPLAVDCSDLRGHQLPDGSSVTSPGLLLSALVSDDLVGDALLRMVNSARWEAMDTHAAVGWEDLYPTSEPLALRCLWAGKAPPCPAAW